MFTIIGVIPSGFRFPLSKRNAIYTPIHLDHPWMSFDGYRSPHWLKPGVTLGEAQAELGIACRLLERQYPETIRQLSARTFSLRQLTVSRVNLPLLALLAATGLILLLACANVAALLLARGALRN
jgi:hypothetical protein